MNTEELFVVWKSCDGSEAGTINLCAQDVVKKIYRQAGGDYKLVERPSKSDSGKSVFEIHFKESANMPWCKSYRIAEGVDEKWAEQAFLLESFHENMWKTNEWCVFNMEVFDKYQKELLEYEGN